jgi:hypothetical protein
VVRRIEMKRGPRVVLIGLGLSAAFGGGVVGWLALRSIPPVKVVVRNTSEKAIAAVRVEHERGVETIQNLARGEARTIQFMAGGETSYTLRVRFADGSEVSGNPQYAESGYEIVETVTDSGIKSDVRLPTRY